MRHFISLGIRGVLLEIGGLLMRVQGGISYRMKMRRRRSHQKHTNSEYRTANANAE